MFQAIPLQVDACKHVLYVVPFTGTFMKLGMYCHLVDDTTNSWYLSSTFPPKMKVSCDDGINERKFPPHILIKGFTLQKFIPEKSTNKANSKNKIIQIHDTVYIWSSWDFTDEIHSGTKWLVLLLIHYQMFALVSGKLRCVVTCSLASHTFAGLHLEDF